MDPRLNNSGDSSERNFSYPNSDQVIPGVTDSSMPEKEEPQYFQPTARHTVNIIDALDSQKRVDENNRKIRTYQEDIADAIKSDNVSMIKVALAEKKRQERQGAPLQLDDENPGKKYFIMGAVGAVLLILLVGGYILFLNSSSSGATGSESQAPLAPLLYTEQNLVINVDGKDSDDITRLVNRELNDPLDLGTMRSLTLVSSTGTGTSAITTAEFLSDLQTHASDTLINALDSRFLLGMYSYSPDDFFLIVKVNSYDSAFASMLQWEPDIENDLGSIFITRQPTAAEIAEENQTEATDTTAAIDTNTVSNGDGTGTDNGIGDNASDTNDTGSTPVSAQETAPDPALFRTSYVWVDRVVDNEDTRALVDADGNIEMLYTFLDKQTLVIASSDKSLKEVEFRLTAGRIAR